jgi:sialate O-acetylesterase
VWGNADKGEKVEVSFNGQKLSTRAGKDGKWSVSLARMEAGGPDTIEIGGKDNTVTFDDILVGEVWLCSGQSNMGWTVGQSMNADLEIKAADYPRIRCFTAYPTAASEPVDDLWGRNWTVCSPSDVSHFSGVGYFFARKLWQELEVPIGIINSSWGGTDIEVWTSQGSYEAIMPEVAHKNYDPASRFNIPKDNPNIHYSIVYNAMIHPIQDFRIKGVIWYQGENNSWNAASYRKLFPNLIDTWRREWGYQFPFYWVQLTAFTPEDAEPVESNWAEVREAQTMTLSLPATGQAITIDIGDADDIHPGNKQDVGLRLALIALNRDYGRSDILCSGPVFSSCRFDGDKAVVEFDTRGSGLIVCNKYGYVSGFVMAGADRMFHWAKAAIEDGKVIVQSDAVPEPVAVRYAWSTNPDANLFNMEGLPAAPFRTDDWPGITR